MARLTERAFENAVVRLRDGQGALGQSALDALHEQREELAAQQAKLEEEQQKNQAMREELERLKAQMDAGPGRAPDQAEDNLKEEEVR